MTSFTVHDLERLHDFDAASRSVREALAAALASPVALIRFFGRYVAWNGFFGSGVANLAGKIGRSRSQFIDSSEPIIALSDRSVFVASYFFDAARDEFDDRDTAHRDTHRCLAQATLTGLLRIETRSDPRLGEPKFVNELLADPLWLNAIYDRVRVGYGAGSADDLPSIFRAMGYHLGSEVLADREFSVLDEALRNGRPDMTDELRAMTIDISGQGHNAYQWLSIHSGHGGAAEADHFAWATAGTELALRYVPPASRAGLRHQLELGFIDFTRDHREFFDNVNEPSET